MTTQFSCINWYTHQQAIKTLSEKQKFLTKYINGWLPLGHLVNCYNHKHPIQCPSCNQPIEDTTHFLRCSTRSQWKTKMITNLCSFLETNNTRPMLGDLQQECLLNWSDDRPLSFHKLHPIYHQMLAHQAAIGWEQMFYT